MRRGRILSSAPPDLGPITAVAWPAGLLFFAWTAYWPRPYGLVALVCVLGPLLIPPLLMLGRESLSLFNEETRVTVLPVLLFPSAMAWIRGQFDFAPPLLEPTGWVGPLTVGAALGALLLAILIRVDGGREGWSLQSGFTALMVGLMTWAWGYGSCLLVNGLFDKGPRSVIQAVVVQRSPFDAESRLLVQPLSTPDQRLRIGGVSDSDHALARPKSLVCVSIRTGVLGWRSARITNCPASIQPVPASERKGR